MPLLFSYGTLQEEAVQLSTYGRRLNGQRDELVGSEPALVKIAAPEVAARLGKTHHHNVVFNASDASRVAGTVFEITEAELVSTDAYEAPFFYQRVLASLASGGQAWVYVHANAVRRAALGDEPILRDLRLQALSDAPDAFGSTYERELARTPADWQRWLSPGATFILEGSEGPCGIVACAHDAAEPAVVELMAMWVTPSARGSPGGDALVSAVLDWACGEGATTVRLKVVEGNARARRFYERNGFCVTSAHRLRARDGQIELQMERGVGQT
jgi:GNAT superfamily N-acetyltransferase